MQLHLVSHGQFMAAEEQQMAWQAKVEGGGG